MSILKQNKNSKRNTNIDANYDSLGIGVKYVNLSSPITQQQENQSPE